MGASELGSEVAKENTSGEGAPNAKANTAIITTATNTTTPTTSAAAATATAVAHGRHTLDIECKGVFVHRGIKTVGRESSWCRPNSEYHKALAPFFIPI